MNMKDERNLFKSIYKISHKLPPVYCYICHKPITKQKDLTIDHEPPRSRQEELGHSNLYPCCAKCNHQKGSLTLEEYKQWLVLERKRNGNQK